MRPDDPIDPSDELDDLVEEMDVIDFETAEGQDEGIRSSESAGADSAEEVDPVEKMGLEEDPRLPRRQRP